MTKFQTMLKWLGQHEVTLIEIGVVMSAVTRWMFAIAASEGAYVSEAFRPAWDVLVFVLAGAMALVEGMGIKYSFDAWAKTRSKMLISLIVLAALSFVMVLGPGVVASSTDRRIDVVLDSPSLWVWSTAVALSTMFLLGAVAYGKAEVESKPVVQAKPKAVQTESSPKPKAVRIETKEDYFKANESRNGQGHIPAGELMSQYGISKSRAFAWQKEWLSANPSSDSKQSIDG